MDWPYSAHEGLFCPRTMSTLPGCRTKAAIPLASHLSLLRLWVLGLTFVERVGLQKLHSAKWCIRQVEGYNSSPF
jgi:hypothetical protein